MLGLLGKSLLLSLQNAYETLAIAAPTVLDALRGTLSREVCDIRIESWASRVVANAEIAVSVRGRENVEPGQTYLVMSNHASFYDVALVYYVLGGSIRMVGKRELFELPLFGRAIRAAGFIPVDRQNRKQAIASLDEAKESLAAGVPIWIAPEGTRSVTGELLPFKKGGFFLALEAGIPVLPVSLRGTRDVLRAKGLRSRKGVEVTVTIHPAVDPKRFGGLGAKPARDALADEVRRAVASGL
jgi:1-acyl-sn-glycerol-3-phosphate acyltransferase